MSINIEKGFIFSCIKIVFFSILILATDKGYKYLK